LAELEKEREKEKEKEKKATKDSEHHDKQPESSLYSTSFKRCLKIMERMVV